MANKAIFLDRDNTLIEDPGYINSPEQVELLDGVPEALKALRAMDYKLIVVSNQSAVARGIVTEIVLGEIHERLEKLLSEKGVSLDRIYYCPFHRDASVAKYRKKSEMRKPEPGMLLKAAEQMDIDLEQSWMIGNSDSDIEAGLRAGCKTILIDNPLHGKQPLFATSEPDYKAVNMKESVNIVKKYNRTTEKTHAETQLSRRPKRKRILKSDEQSITEEAEEQQNSARQQNISGEKTEKLLGDILKQLKKAQRAEMFGEFSIMRFLAGFLQITVPFCLLISVWFLMSPPPRQDNLIFFSLGFAMVFQVMALTFYIMQGKK